MSSKKKQQNIYATAAKRMASYQAEQASAAAVADKRGRDLKLGLIATLAAIAVALGAQWAYFGFGPGKAGAAADPSASASVPANSSAVPAPALSEDREWNGSIKINGASLGLKLDGKNAPQAVANFVTLAKKGFFNGISCHRITTAGIYVLQCGDPKGDGTGGPGYSWGPIENAPVNDAYGKGVLAMARQGGNGSSMGSQFFIVYENSSIPSDSAGGYTRFGTIDNLDALSEIIAAGSDNANGQGDGHPVLKTTIDSVSVK